MARKLSLTHDADKFLAHLDSKQFKQLVRRIFALATNAAPSDASKLKGSSYYRIDQGEYRIVYSFDDDTVYIVVVGKRKDDEVYVKARQK